MIRPIEQHRPGPGDRAAARLGGRVQALDTPRLQLRGPRIYDFESFADILCSDRAEFIGGPLSRPEAWAEFTNYTALWMLHGHGLWTIDSQAQPSAGFVTLGYEYDDPEPELGVFVGVEAEGKGLACEAAEAARRHAFDVLRWDSIVSYVDAANIRCVALMKRLGAFRDGQAESALGCGTLVFRHVPGGAA